MGVKWHFLIIIHTCYGVPGFEIVHQSEQMGVKKHGGGRWIRVLAVKGGN